MKYARLAGPEDKRTERDSRVGASRRSKVPTFRSKALMELEMGKSGEMENDAERNLIMSLMRAGCDGQNCQS